MYTINYFTIKKEKKREGEKNVHKKILEGKFPGVNWILEGISIWLFFFFFFIGRTERKDIFSFRKKMPSGSNVVYLLLVLHYFLYEKKTYLFHIYHWKFFSACSFHQKSERYFYLIYSIKVSYLKNHILQIYYLKAFFKFIWVKI